MSLPTNERSATVVAHNLRRIMAQEGFSHGDLAAAVKLDERTLRGVLRGDGNTRPSTLNKIAAGLGVSVDELFQPPLGMSPATFDAATNPAFEVAIAKQPELFEGWVPSDFAELASRFGVGGQLTEDGVLEAARVTNARRQLLTRARVVLESQHANLLEEFIDVLYERVMVKK